MGRLVHATETVASVGVGAWQQRQSKLARFRKLRCVVNTFEEAISRAAPDSGHARALFLGERAAPRAVLHAMSLAGAIGLHVLISLKIQCTVNLVVCSSRRFLPRVWMLELDNQKIRARGVFWLATDRFDEFVKSQVPGKSKALGRWILLAAQWLRGFCWGSLSCVPCGCQAPNQRVTKGNWKKLQAMVPRDGVYLCLSCDSAEGGGAGVSDGDNDSSGGRGRGRA